MKSSRSGLALFFLLAICDYGRAQPAADAATDQELLAAYCMGAASQDRHQTTMVRSQRERFRSYLTARGVWSTRRSLITVTGVSIAAQQGKKDVAECDKRGNYCLDRCFSAGIREMDEVADCAVDCQNEAPACSQSFRCRDESAFPPK